MAPSTSPASLLNPLLQKRCNDCCSDDFDYNCCDGWDDNCDNNWDSYGRWIAVVVIIIVILVLAFTFSYYSNRKRRIAGRPAMYGTGWVPIAGKPNLPPRYQVDDQNPAPPYQAQAPPSQYGNFFHPNNHTGSTTNENSSTTGGQQTGIELTHPSHSYQPRASSTDDAPEYSPPEGPPPTAHKN